MRYWFILLCIICIAGCSEEERSYTAVSGDPENGGTFVEGVLRDAICLNPVIAKDSASMDVINLLFNGLVKYDADYNIVGDLAESWQVSEDGKEVLFKLKKGIKWHDGTLFTAHDVAFTYELIKDPKNKSVRRQVFELVKSVKAVDDLTVMIIYDEVYPPFLESWQIKIVPRHILQGKNIIIDDFNRNPVGTGMFKLSEWVSDERITLVRNKDYFDGAPYIEKYVFKIIPEATVLNLELMYGRIDLFARMTPVQFKDDRQTKKSDVEIARFHYPRLGYTYLGFNNSREIFKDERVRKAITHAVNRQEIIEGVLEGYGHISTGPFYIYSWAYNANLIPCAYNPEISRNLLKEAGYTDTDGDGFMEKDGQKLSFDITVDMSHRNRMLVAMYVKENLKKAGIDVSIKKLSWGSLISQVSEKKEYDTVILGWNLNIDPDIYQIWHSSGIASGYNFLGYRNARVDELLENARKELSYDRRKDMYREIHKIIYNEQPCVFLFQEDDLVGINKRVKNITCGKAGIKHNVNKWYIKTKKSRGTE